MSQLTVSITSSQIEVYRALLLDKKRFLRAGLGLKRDSGNENQRINEEDQAQSSHDEFLALSLNNLDYTQLRLIDAALDRIAAGDFGVCLDCDEEIPERRLKAIAWAKYCVKCQDKSYVEDEE